MSQRSKFELLHAPPHLVKWLTTAGGTREYRRVRILIEAITQFEDLAKARKKLDREIYSLEGCIRYLLRRYRLVPRLSWSWTSGDWDFGIATMRCKEDSTTITVKTPMRCAYRETNAVITVLRLAETNRLHRLLQCEHCLEWFFARFKHQVFCNEACQTADYHSSEEWKAKRREYMRGYRTEQKRRDECARNRARLWVRQKQ